MLTSNSKEINTHSLVLIERDPLLYASWPSLIRKKRIPELSVTEVVSKYQGFEGELVCLFKINENIIEFNETLNSYLSLKELGSCFLLHVISPPSEMPPFFKNQTVKLGYDIGVCEEESTIYSSIFHEILFGAIDELAAYKDTLNENFLFPNLTLAENYVHLHNQLSAQGKDVEDYMEMIIYEIWKHNEPRLDS